MKWVLDVKDRPDVNELLSRSFTVNMKRSGHHRDHSWIQHCCWKYQDPHPQAERTKTKIFPTEGGSIVLVTRLLLTFEAKADKKTYLGLPFKVICSFHRLDKIIVLLTSPVWVYRTRCNRGKQSDQATHFARLQTRQSDATHRFCFPRRVKTASRNAEKQQPQQQKEEGSSSIIRRLVFLFS